MTWLPRAAPNVEISAKRRGQPASRLQSLIALMLRRLYRDPVSATTSITIRKLDPRLKQRLRVRAARHGRSMEEEAREILRVSLADERDIYGRGFVNSIRERFAKAGYVELKLPPREPMREPPERSASR